MSKETFAKWIVDEVERRGWSYSELARRAEVSTAQVSDVVNLKSNPGDKFCLGVARAFRMSPSEVFRLAGRLPSIPAEIEREKELIYKVRKLRGAAREQVFDFVDYLYHYKEKRDE